MAVGKSIRIYDLAREVKQDTKRVMEDVRREGVDVSVASNSVPFEVAEKVRNKYFPKTEAAPKRAIKVIKKAKDAAPAHEPEEPVEIPTVESAPAVEEAPAPAVEPVKAPATPKVRRVARKVADEEVPAPTPATATKRLVKKKVEEPAPEPPVVEAEEPAAPVGGR